jgi:alpha-beta hydrolase superfamily lysophospholipase
MTIRLLRHGELPKGLTRSDTDEARREAERHRRAMPLTRLLGNGMEYWDATRLHELAGGGYAWHQVGEWLGDRNIAQAENALSLDRRITARTFFRRATACYRFAQSAFPSDTDVKRALYAKLVAAFGRAAALEEPPGERLEMAFRGSHLCAWLLRPAQQERAPVVIIIGGADGWREEYQEGARHLLERGIAVLLAELPGQGETRLMRGLYLAEDVDRAVGAMLDRLTNDERLLPRVGIWGNSMGGSFAAFAASRDRRLAACCVNGGSATPTEVIERFPAIVEKLQAMVGTAARNAATELIAALSVTGADNHINCPLLVLHGEPDRIFLVENARRLYDEAPTRDKELLIWDDGEHCLYNHSEEKHALVADWFAARLAP